ncbi:cytochrome P450 [Dictyobacter arantiisoli]|uniref:Cytochrome P450 n=2 Tax=Dictyobacter arantiisoli TaxID=2014874 RepID=A0A5A5TAN8_9CHLR|nr:cytochrome P450 [Dictyobacter arantiisoli]
MAKSTVISQTRSSLPGPQGLPLLGGKVGMLQLYQQPVTYLRHMYNTYGDIVVVTKNDPMFVFAFGPQYNFRLLSDPDLFHVSTDKTFKKVPHGTALTRLWFNNLQRMNGDQHKQQRRLMMPSFHKKQIVHYHNDMIDQTQRMLDQWQANTGSELNLLLEMQRLTQAVTVKTLFGLDDDVKVKSLGDQMQNLVKITSLGLLIPIDFPGSPYRQALKAAQKFEAEIRAIIEQKRAQPEATDVMAMLIQAHDEDGEKLNEDNLIGHAFALYVAGHETTANALTWTHFLLEQHPHSLADLLDELDAKLHGAPPTIEQLSQLPLLESVVKESMRLFPPAMAGLRITTEACELGGFELAANTNIMYSEFITHRMPELYEEPDRFKPERWLALDRSPYEYLPFSAGHHMCIAASFAMQELKIVLAMMLQRYRLAVRPNVKISTNLRMHAQPGMPVRIFAQDRQFKRTPVRGPIQSMVDIR